MIWPMWTFWKIWKSSCCLKICRGQPSHSIHWVSSCYFPDRWLRRWTSDQKGTYSNSTTRPVKCYPPHSICVSSQMLMIGLCSYDWHGNASTPPLPRAPTMNQGVALSSAIKSKASHMYVQWTWRRVAQTVTDRKRRVLQQHICVSSGSWYNYRISKTLSSELQRYPSLATESRREHAASELMTDTCKPVVGIRVRAHQHV